MSVIVTVTSPLDSYAAEREEQILAAAARGGVKCRTVGEPLKGVREQRWHVPDSQTAERMRERLHRVQGITVTLKAGD